MSLLAAVRALQERAASLDRLANDARELHATTAAAGYALRADAARQQGEVARQLMIDLLQASR